VNIIDMLSLIDSCGRIRFAVEVQVMVELIRVDRFVSLFFVLGVRQAFGKT